MLLIPQGTFQMGCSASLLSTCNSDENPVHQVQITRSFYLGRYEVTQAQWATKMGSNPSSFQGYADSANRPVEQVSWNTVQSFLSATSMRLPTEAEWEYACRAGTSTAFCNGSSDDNTIGTLAWFSANASQTRAIGQKPANDLGLFDIVGNVSEWVVDWYSGTYYLTSPTQDPLGPSSGSSKLVRGGSWALGSTPLRSSHRGWVAPTFANSDLGLRAARNP
jgi:formylglycine-generating enzyme required for sulfatase activity